MSEDAEAIDLDELHLMHAVIEAAQAVVDDPSDSNLQALREALAALNDGQSTSG